MPQTLERGAAAVADCFTRRREGAKKEGLFTRRREGRGEVPCRAELRKAMNDYLIELGQPPIDWTKEEG